MMDIMINTKAWKVQVQILTQRLDTQDYSDRTVWKQRKSKEYSRSICYRIRGVSGFSQRRTGFAPRAIHEGSPVDL